MPTPTFNTTALSALQCRIWSGSLPLEIRLAPSDCRSFADSDPYLIHFPRFSYLAFLLPRLHAFFAHKLIDPSTPVNDAWLEFEGVPLKWHYPTGLLYDLYSGAEPVDLAGEEIGEEEQIGGKIDGQGEGPLPWRLVVHYSEYPAEQLLQLDTDGKVLLDTFINAVKEADFVRNGSARTVMGLSREDSESLWRSVETHDLPLFNTINIKLLSPPGVTIRHIPLKIYLPSSASQDATHPIPEEQESSDANVNPTAPAGHIRVVQSLVPLQLPSKLPQTMGTALATAIPAIFPSRRKPIYAQPVLHGVVVPMSANLSDLGKAASYADGFLHIGVVMMG